MKKITLFFAFLLVAVCSFAATQTIIVDGSKLTSTATTAESTLTFEGVDFVFSSGAKSQASSGENKFADKAILIGKQGSYIYNSTAIPGKITKFEIYANKGASAKVSVGVCFGTSKITELAAEGAYTATLSTLDNVYDASSAIVENATYFYYEVTNAYNSQVQFRITYELEAGSVSAPTFSVASGNYYGTQNVELAAEEGADIYYSTDGETFAKYTSAIAVTEDTKLSAYAQVGENKSATVSASYVIAKSYASITEIWNVEANNQPVNLTLTNAKITSIYTTASGNRNGIYVTEGTDTIEVYSYNVPAEWEEGGSVSGTVSGTWQLYKGTKEVCPSDYSGLTYSAPVFEPVDVTSKLVNPSFENGLTEWNTVEAGIAKVSSGNGNKALSGNNVPFEFNQTVEGLEPGVYTLKFQAFGRMKSNADSWADYLAGTLSTETNVFIYANDAQKEAMNVVYGAVASKVSGDWSSHEDAEGNVVYLLNNSGAVADAFSQGMYEDELTGIIVGSDGKLLLGIKKTSDRGSDGHYNYYGGADNFRLYYNGPLKVTNEEVEALVATAPTAKMNAAVKSAMDTAIETLKADKNATNYEAASEAIKNAVASAKAYADVKAAMDAIETAKTTDAAKAEAKAAISEIASAYEAGTIAGDGAAEVEAINAALTAAIDKAEAAVTTAKLEELGAAAATEANPVDVTSVLVNPSFTDGDKGWTWETQGIAKVTNYGGNSSITGNNNSFAIYQTIKGLMPGKYILKAQTFGRKASNVDSWASYLAGEEMTSGAYLFANDAETESPNIVTGAVSTKGSGDYSTHTDAEGATVYILNNSKSASEVFANASLYETEVEVLVGEDGVLKLGYKKTTSSSDYTLYGGCDNFRLIYCGEPVVPNTIPAGEYDVTVYITPCDEYEVPEKLQKYINYTTTGSLEGDENKLTVKADEFSFNGFEIKGDKVAYDPTMTVVFEDMEFHICDANNEEKQSGSFNINTLKEGKYYSDTIGIIYKGLFVGTIYCEFVTHEVPTAIDSINATAKAGKIYNISGQQLNSLQKGINIVGGKKILVK